MRKEGQKLVEKIRFMLLSLFERAVRKLSSGSKSSLVFFVRIEFPNPTLLKEAEEHGLSRRIVRECAHAASEALPEKRFRIDNGSGLVVEGSSREFTVRVLEISRSSKGSSRPEVKEAYDYPQ